MQRPSDNHNGTATVADILPHSVEAEKAVLGSILIDPDAFYEVDTIVNHDHFYSKAHGIIYKAIADLFGNKTAVDLLTVTETVKRRGLNDHLGTVIEVYLSDLINAVPTAINAANYARIVEADAMRRRLILAGREISNYGVNGDGNVAQMVEKSEKALFAVTQVAATRNITTIKDSMRRLMDVTFEKIETGNHETGLKTGFADLDKILRGLKRQGLYILAARPGMGKSMLESLIASSVARNYGAVARFNMEMSAESLAQRAVSAHSGVPFNAVEDAKMSPDQMSKFTESVGYLSSLPMFIDDSAGLTMSQLSAKARRLHAEHGLKLVTLDYLQLMAVDNSYGNRTQDVGQISRGLKRLAKELDIPILALAQLSRSCEARNDKRPQLSDLRDSGEIEQDADCVMFIYRDDYYNPDTSERPNIAEVSVAKHRNGPTGTADLYFNGGIMRFSNLEKRTINL